MYQKILIPVDGSPGAEKAAQHGVELAEKINAAVTLINVLPLTSEMKRYTDWYVSLSGKRRTKSNITPVPDAESNIDWFKEISDHEQARIEEIFTKIQKDLAKYNVAVDTKMVTGDPAREICQEASDGKYDLIIIGSSGLGELKDPRMGGVSERVVRRADVSVLTVR